jgi:hypothetical protein
MQRRFGKPTTAGYVVLAVCAVIIIAIVVGVIVGGGTGATIDTVGGVLLVALIFALFRGLAPRLPGDDPRDHLPPEPPGPRGLP